MNVGCFLGGYDGPFRRCENTKRNLEHRTHSSDWSVDSSLYGKTLSAREIDQIEDPIMRAVAEQDFLAREARKRFKRTTPQPSYGGGDWDPMIGW